MPRLERRLTIEDELKRLEIDSRTFGNFYHLLKQKEALPPKESFPEEQYDTIVNYLHQRGVLEEDNTISKKGLNLMDTRIELELDRSLEVLMRDLTPRGGINPCRMYRMSLSRGGINPCRYL